MTQAPEWFCPPGHPRTEQLGKLWNAGQRERRTGGRALQEAAGLFGEALLWSRQVDQLDRDFAEYRKRLEEFGARMGERTNA